MINIKMPFCIILAAGNSTRLGRPKALINLDGEYLIEFIINKIKKYDLEILVITNSDLYDQLKKSIPKVRILINPNPDLGRTGTLQIGLKFLEDKLDILSRVIVVPVDRPGFSDNTLSKLIKLEDTYCPIKDGKGGHPLLLSRYDIQKVLNSDPNIPLNKLIMPSKIQVNDEFLHLNVDTEEDVKLLIKYYNTLKEN